MLPLRYFKKKTHIDGITTGDFFGFDAAILGEELKAVGARCDTEEVIIKVYPIDPMIELSDAIIRPIIEAHGSEEAVAARAAKKAKDETNAPIYVQLEALDKKRIRAVCEGDQEYLDTYNAQAQQLRSQLV